jgi:hypothetical protein
MRNVAVHLKVRVQELSLEISSRLSSPFVTNLLDNHKNCSK